MRAKSLALSIGIVVAFACAEAAAATLLVANKTDGTVDLVDPETGKSRATLPTGKRALVSCARDGEVAVFDVPTRRELLRRKLELSNAPDAAMRLFGDRFGDSPVPVGLVVSADSKKAWVVATLDVIDLIEAGKEPDGMAITPVGASPTS